MRNFVVGAGAAALLIFVGDGLQAVPLRLRAAEQAGFAMWKAADSKSHDAALATHVGADHSSRETLAEFKDQREAPHLCAAEDPRFVESLKVEV